MIKSFFAKLYATQIAKKIEKWSTNPIKTQDKVFSDLITQAKITTFGKDHQFDKIQNYEDFKANVPIRDYEGLRPYIDQILDGKENVLWQGNILATRNSSRITSVMILVILMEE